MTKEELAEDILELIDEGCVPIDIDGIPLNQWLSEWESQAMRISIEISSKAQQIQRSKNELN